MAAALAMAAFCALGSQNTSFTVWKNNMEEKECTFTRNLRVASGRIRDNVNDISLVVSKVPLSIKDKIFISSYLTDNEPIPEGFFTEKEVYLLLNLFDYSFNLQRTFFLDQDKKSREEFENIVSHSKVGSDGYKTFFISLFPHSSKNKKKVSIVHSHFFI